MSPQELQNRVEELLTLWTGVKPHRRADVASAMVRKLSPFAKLGAEYVGEKLRELDRTLPQRFVGDFYALLVQAGMAGQDCAGETGSPTSTTDVVGGPNTPKQDSRSFEEGMLNLINAQLDQGYGSSSYYPDDYGSYELGPQGKEILNKAKALLRAEKIRKVREAGLAAGNAKPSNEHPATPSAMHKPTDSHGSSNSPSASLSQLSIQKHREEILKAIEASDVLIVSAETGSGKSTQIPQYCYELLCRSYPAARASASSGPSKGWRGHPAGRGTSGSSKSGTSASSSPVRPQCPEKGSRDFYGRARRQKDGLSSGTSASTTTSPSSESSRSAVGIPVEIPVPGVKPPLWFTDSPSDPASENSLAPPVPPVPLVGVSEPRRISAISLANRVSQEMRCGRGGGPTSLVAHSVRFDDTATRSTRIRYCTDGVLLSEASQDNLLSKYAYLILDEVHERNLNTDILLALAKRAAELRSGKKATMQGQSAPMPGASALPPLKLILTSATMDIDNFKSYFAKTLKVSTLELGGRPHKVDIVYDKTPEEEPGNAQSYSGASSVDSFSSDPFDKFFFYDGDDVPTTQPIEPRATQASQPDTHSHQEIDKRSDAAIAREAEELPLKCAEAILFRHLTEPMPGDFLVFLTGAEEISQCQFLVSSIFSALRSWARGYPVITSEDIPAFEILPCHASLDPEVQQRIFKPQSPTLRKIVLATNIAETSITIPGISLVIDGGFVKRLRYDASACCNRLVPCRISQAQAAQRAGRAGRTSHGTCLRLYSEERFNSLDARSTPEILLQNLENVVLTIKSVLPTIDPFAFDFLERPSRANLQAAVSALMEYGALDGNLRLTEEGRRMAKIPVDAKYSKMILTGSRSGCLAEMVAIVSVLSVTGGGSSIFRRARRDQDPSEEEPVVRLTQVCNVLDEFRRENVGGDHIVFLVTLARFMHACSRKQWLSFKISRRAWANAKGYSLKHLDQAVRIYRQLVGTCRSLGLTRQDFHETLDTATPNPQKREAIVKAIISGSPRNIAKRSQYSSFFTCTSTDQSAEIHRNSMVGGIDTDIIVYDELLVVRRPYFHVVSGVKPEWLPAKHKESSNITSHLPRKGSEWAAI